MLSNQDYVEAVLARYNESHAPEGDDRFSDDQWGEIYEEHEISLRKEKESKMKMISSFPEVVRNWVISTLDLINQSSRQELLSLQIGLEYLNNLEEKSIVNLDNPKLEDISRIVKQIEIKQALLRARAFILQIIEDRL